MLLRDPTGNEPPLPGDDDVKVSIMVKGHGLHICNLAQVPHSLILQIINSTGTNYTGKIQSHSGIAKDLCNGDKMHLLGQSIC